MYITIYLSRIIYVLFSYGMFYFLTETLSSLVKKIYHKLYIISYSFIVTVNFGKIIDERSNQVFFVKQTYKMSKNVQY